MGYSRHISRLREQYLVSSLGAVAIYRANNDHARGVIFVLWLFAILVIGVLGSLLVWQAGHNENARTLRHGSIGSTSEWRFLTQRLVNGSTFIPYKMLFCLFGAIPVPP